MSLPTLPQLLLLGTDRATTIPPPPHSSLESVWTVLDWKGAREIAVMEAAAIAGLAQLAGAQPTTRASSVGPAPRDTAQETSAVATQLLEPLLEPELRPLLKEWLELCAQSSQRIPAFFLPRLLNRASFEERTALAQVVGERGRWLAAQNPAWQWALSPPQTAAAAEVWETGTEPERLGYLRTLRAIDPSAARTLLEKTWSQDPPEFRERALEWMKEGLTLADEPFLEKMLRDRRREIRQTAQLLLCRLPESGLARRMVERATSLLAFKKSFFGKKLDVTLPSVFDPTWKADGLEEKPPVGVGEKAFWARQILECVPARVWSARFEVSLDSLVALAVSSEWSDLLLGAWFRSLRLAPDPEVALALFLPVTAQPSCLPSGLSLGQGVGLLLEPCSAEQRWRLAEQRANQPAILWACLPVLLSARAGNHARAVLRGLAPALRDGLVPGGSPQAVLAARCLPPHLHDEAQRLLQRESGMTKLAEAFLRALELRARLHAAFNF